MDLKSVEKTAWIRLAVVVVAWLAVVVKKFYFPESFDEGRFTMLGNIIVFLGPLIIPVEFYLKYLRKS